jgi:hypothetical protein
MDIIISEKPDSIVFETKDGFKQVGKGMILFICNEKLHTIENGEVKGQREFTGCDLAQQEMHTSHGDNTYTMYYFLGESYSGEVWGLCMYRNRRFTLEHRSTEQRIDLDRNQVFQLLRGLTFQEFVAQVTEAERRREMEALRAKAAVGMRFLQNVDELISVNEQAGAGSRKKLREMLLDLKMNG